MNILIIDWEENTLNTLVTSLTKSGHTVDTSMNGAEALELISLSSYDVVVMELSIPGMDGITLLKSLRGRNISTPLLVLSHQSTVADRIEALYAGADDFMAKPGAPDELLARLTALYRRSGDSKSVLLRVGDLTLDVPRRIAKRGRSSVDLSMREFRLLEVLMRNESTPCERGQLLKEVWDYEFDPGTNLVDVYIRKLRGKLEAGSQATIIHTVRGTGYMIRA